MLYTIVPPEIVWQDNDKVVAPQELMHLGQRVLAEPLATPGEFKLIRLLSSDPELFLSKDFQPGTVISFPARTQNV